MALDALTRRGREQRGWPNFRKGETSPWLDQARICSKAFFHRRGIIVPSEGR